MTKQTVIFDLDDTLADTRSTNDGIACPISERIKIMAKGAALPLVETAKAMIASGTRVIIVTARTDSPETHAQVARFGLSVEILFRPAGDNRVDHKVKADHVAALLASGTKIVQAFDDKIKNVEMFESFGIPSVLV